MSIKPLLRLARAGATVAGVTVAASGPPVLGTVNEVTLRLASVRYENEKLRHKVVEAANRRRMPSAACHWALDRETRSKQSSLA
jgi:hypothetical protein